MKIDMKDPTITSTWLPFRANNSSRNKIYNEFNGLQQP
jgi:hypothetical protein